MLFVHAICIVVTPQLGSVHWGTKCAEQRNIHIWGTHTKFPYKHIALAVKLVALTLNVPINKKMNDIPPFLQLNSALPVLPQFPWGVFSNLFVLWSPVEAFRQVGPPGPRTARQFFWTTKILHYHIQTRITWPWNLSRLGIPCTQEIRWAYVQVFTNRIIWLVWCKYYVPVSVNSRGGHRAFTS